MGEHKKTPVNGIFFGIFFGVFFGSQALTAQDISSDCRCQTVPRTSLSPNATGMERLCCALRLLRLTLALAG